MTSIERTVLRVPQVIRGRVAFGDDVEYGSRTGTPFRAAALDLDELITPRSEPGPAFDLPIDEILDFLVETGKRLVLENNPYLQEALDASAGKVNQLSRRVLEHTFEDMRRLFDRERLEFQIERELGGVGGKAAMDGWVAYDYPGQPTCRVRAFPPRAVHVLAGNGGPAVPAKSIVRAAITKGIHLMKMPSNDIYSATSILRTMADIDPDHPVVRSLSAVYWRGGDASIEDVVYRAQYFDKVVAWGGDAAIRNVLQYIGPGLELINYDPKVSISMIGEEVFVRAEDFRAAVEAGAWDVACFNQEGCVNSRYQFVAGTREQVDRYCGALAEALGVDSYLGDAKGPAPSEEIRENVGIFRHLGDQYYRVWGEPDGRGLVIRSDEPVDFHPIGKTVNVVRVDDLDDAIQHVTVATQTVGVYPPARKAALRDRLATAGAQRVVNLGLILGQRDFVGLPHDGMLPLVRLMRWASDEG